MSNLRLFILIDDSMSMASKFGLGKAETILIGAKRIVKHFLSQTEKNPRLEILIQGKINITGHPMSFEVIRCHQRSSNDSSVLEYFSPITVY